MLLHLGNVTVLMVGSIKATKVVLKIYDLNSCSRPLLLGGVDTGAITMVWAMAELAKRPTLMKNAQDEVRTCIGNLGKLSESDADQLQLQYLKIIFKETLRLHPSTPVLLHRETISHFKVNGYDIQPKTLLQVNAWAIGRDPDTWKDPEEFIPARFMDSTIDFKGCISSCCHLVPVDGLVLPFIWEQQQWSLDLQTCYTILTGNCLMEPRSKISIWKR
ncbi:Cytochrome P450, E-class, group I [Parasponia andersonii]|uniref:Cytochrome P450, E-class, group I n=1 Tax=Parasponia andersonii TaxID=3476 RepID=A0A2P5AWM4_PARAD|nr:Cytochrome P450, E-class, group I [Parasponia andersonii]